MATVPLSSLPSLLARALAIETDRLEDLRLRAWSALGIVLVVAGALTWLILEARQGVIVVCLGVVVTGWFATAARLRWRGAGATVVSIAIEQSVFITLFIGAVLFDDARRAARLGPTQPVPASATTTQATRASVRARTIRMIAEGRGLDDAPGSH